MSKAERTLKEILNLVTKDVKRIKKEYKTAEDKNLNSLMLSRYVSILVDIDAAQDKGETKAKRTLDSASTEELIAAYNATNSLKQKDK